MFSGVSPISALRFFTQGRVASAPISPQHNSTGIYALVRFFLFP